MCKNNHTLLFGVACNRLAFLKKKPKTASVFCLSQFWNFNFVIFFRILFSKTFDYFETWMVLACIGKPNHNSFEGKLPFYIWKYPNKFHSSCKKSFFPLNHFPRDFEQSIIFWIALTDTWDPYRHFGLWERWGNKTYQSMSNIQSLAYWFGGGKTLWRCGIG